MTDTTTTTELDTRAKLLEASGPVFAARGYDRATVREICAAAGVNVASVGYHFGDKLGLYRELIRQVRESRQRQFPTPYAAGDDDPAASLARVVRTLMSRILAADPSGWESQLFMREMQNPTPVFEDIVVEYFKPLHDRLLQNITVLINDPSVSDHVIQQLALSVVGQCVHYKVGADAIKFLVPAQQRESHFDVETISRHITAVTLAAIQSDEVIRPENER
ncbi:MAG: CerR family C-terminal domain-containing protein [Rubripirellula sp.]